MPESWSSPESGSPRNSQRSSQRSSQPSRLRRGPDPLEQGLDRLVSAGRQLVDGVSGARPGLRGGPRGEGSRGTAASAGASLRPRLDQLGRWVEDKLDWMLEDEEDWREPWEASARQAEPGQPWEAPPSKRRPLEARSRRTARPADPEVWSMDSHGVLPGNSPGHSPGDSPEDWPDDASFVIPRWQRQPAPPQGQAPLADGRRPLPRSTRLRSPLD